MNSTSIFSVHPGAALSRTVFRKRALGGCPYGELAREYGKSESWARVTVCRARMRILQMLNEEEHPHG